MQVGMGPHESATSSCSCWCFQLQHDDAGGCEGASALRPSPDLHLSVLTEKRVAYGFKRGGHRSKLSVGSCSSHQPMKSYLEEYMRTDCPSPSPPPFSRVPSTWVL